MSDNPLSFPGHLRAVTVLGLPLVGGHLAQFAIGLTDTVMIGWYGVPELAALTLAHSYFFTLFLLGCGFAWAIMPMVATFAAQGDETQIRRATRMSLWLSILYFAATMPLLWFAGPILRAMGQDAEIAAMAELYLRVAGWGMLPGLGVMAFKNYLAGLEHTRIVLWITVAAAGANVVANYALIFGNWGAPELGIAGAGIASVLSNLAMLALVIYTRCASCPSTRSSPLLAPRLGGLRPRLCARPADRADHAGRGGALCGLRRADGLARDGAAGGARDRAPDRFRGLHVPAWPLQRRHGPRGQRAWPRRPGPSARGAKAALLLGFIGVPCRWRCS